MLERLAAAAVLVATICAGAYFIFDLERRVAKLESLLPVQIPALPSGTILPYVDSKGTAHLPKGWVLCGSADTPEMDGRFLIGTNKAGQVGTPTGSADHSHRAVFKTSYTIDLQQNPGRETLDNYTHGRDLEHKHEVDTKTQHAEHLPPSIKVLFFCKQ